MANFLVTTVSAGLNGATNFDSALWNTHNALSVPPPTGWTCQFITFDSSMNYIWRIVDTTLAAATADATALRRGHSELVLSVAPE